MGTLLPCWDLLTRVGLETWNPMWTGPKVLPIQSEMTWSLHGIIWMTMSTDGDAEFLILGYYASPFHNWSPSKWQAFFLPIFVCFCVHAEKDVSFIMLSHKRGCIGVCFVATIVNSFSGYVVHNYSSIPLRKCKHGIGLSRHWLQGFLTKELETEMWIVKLGNRKGATKVLRNQSKMTWSLHNTKWIMLSSVVVAHAVVFF